MLVTTAPVGQPGPVLRARQVGRPSARAQDRRESAALPHVDRCGSRRQVGPLRELPRDRRGVRLYPRSVRHHAVALVEESQRRSHGKTHASLLFPPRRPHAPGVHRCSVRGLQAARSGRSKVGRCRPRRTRGCAALRGHGRLSPPDQDARPRCTALLRPGHGAGVRLQPRRSDPVVPGRAEARPAVRDVLLGRGTRHGSEHQRDEQGQGGHVARGPQGGIHGGAAGGRAAG